MFTTSIQRQRHFIYYSIDGLNLRFFLPLPLFEIERIQNTNIKWKYFIPSLIQNFLFFSIIKFRFLYDRVRVYTNQIVHFETYTLKVLDFIEINFTNSITHKRTK